ncbi:MAG TPA: UDP binding domain-containing protein, partial [Candidatus Polarisedimenticolia bacterium]
VGCHESETADLLKGLYASVDAPFVPTQIRTAEIVKYLCNTFHALKVCFANEAGDLCEAFGIDPQEAASIFLLDRKLNLSEAYLRPGFAFGGSCLPKDLRALLHAGRSADLSLPLLEAVLQTRRRRVGVVGLSFKAGTDDLRESPMVTLVETLIGKGCDVRILDRNVSLARLVGANRRYIEEEIPHISSLMCDDLETLLAHSEVLVIGSADSAAAEALAEAGGARVVIDLTRGMVPRAAAQTARVAAG